MRLVCGHRALWRTVTMSHSSRTLGVTSSMMLNIVRVSASVNPDPRATARAHFRTALNWRGVTGGMGRRAGVCGETAALGDTECCVASMSASASVLVPAVYGKSVGAAGVAGHIGAAGAADLRAGPARRYARRNDMDGVVNRRELHGKAHFPILSATNFPWP